MDEVVRWNITVSRDTDLALRRYLDTRGAGKGDPCRFIEEAVRLQVFHETVQDIKARNADDDAEALQDLIDDAVQAVRSTGSARAA